jgi:hypothetical protein
MEPSRGERVRDKASDAVVAAAGIVRDVVGEVVMERLTRPKYDDAVGLAMDVLNKRIAVLNAKARHGEKPTQKDSQTIDLLKDIQSEMQTAFAERWNNRERLETRGD